MNWSYITERNAELFPSREAIVFGSERITWSQLNERVNALAKALSELGVQRGDVVAMLLYNCSQFLEITFAVNKIGAVWLPLNFRLTGPEFVYILDHSEAKMLITEEDFFETISTIKPEVPNLSQFIAVGGEAPEGWHDYFSLVNGNLGQEVEHALVELDDLHRIMYTSGTTGHPKGVMLTYGNLYWKSVGHIIMFNITPEDKTLIVGPMYHAGGLDLPATGTLYAGGCVAILRKFDSMKVLEAMDQEKITNVWLAPSMINMLFQEPNFGNYDVSSVRFIIDGGEKMPLALIKELIEKFPNAWFADAYGLTETVSGDTFLSKDKMVEKLGSVGKPVIQLRVRIVDDEGKDVPPGELGEIVLRGPKVFKGYLKDPEGTARAIKDGWFYTGDIGRLDEDGFLYMEDRKKDIIISGGENVSSVEVERVIYEIPEILEVAVVGIRHPKWQEVPKAYVVLRQGQEVRAEDIIDHCTKNLAKFKVPKEVEFIEALPRNPSGKVLKRELREWSD